jgi:RNA polymerase sigma-70 factor (TIGR02943 family)
MDNATALGPETWVDQHGDSLFRFAVLRVRDPDTASDLVQETFLAALRVRDTYSGRSSVRSWLVAILKHKIADHLRRIGREQRFQEGRMSEDRAECTFDRRGHWRTAPLDWGSDPLRESERREFWDALGRCLSRLPAHLADAFLERELEGLSREAICRDLKITPENLSVQLFRARLLLRRCLEVNWFRGRTAISKSSQTLPRATARSRTLEGR